MIKSLIYYHFVCCVASTLWINKYISTEISWETISVIQAKDVSDLDQRDSSEGTKKNIGSEYILEVQPVGFSCR